MSSRRKSLSNWFHLSCWISFSVTSSVGQSKVGTTAAQFLGISVGPRAIAMGGAFVAEGNDIGSLYWNPGAFVQADRTEFAFSNTEWLAGTKFRWFGFMLNLDNTNAFGISLTQLDYGEEEVTTVQVPDGTGQLWAANDLAVAVSYSCRLTDRFSIGGSAKFINQTIWNESASGFTLDVGLLFVTDFNNMRLGMSMSNFGGDLQLDGRDLLTRIDIDPNNSGSNKTLVGKLKTDPWPTPLLFRVGIAMDILNSESGRVSIAVDALRPNDFKETVNLGGEMSWQDLLFVRAGFKGLFANEKVFDKNTQQEGMAFGAGLKYRAEGVGILKIDYANNQFGVFGNLNTISVAFGF